MSDNYLSTTNPADNINCHFSDYLDKRKRDASEHLNGTVPDYCFNLDLEYRKILDSIPGLVSIAKKICGTYASNAIREVNMNGLAVGPNQFPEVYQIGCDCARILGIGVPNIYIIPNQTLNASTVATDDVEPFIQIHSGLYERLTLGELKAVIGHECGHIHNNHVTYSQLSHLLLNGGLIAGASTGRMTQMLFDVLSWSGQAALAAWSRAAEVTCDRAGMICSDNLRDPITSEAKFLYGAAFGEHEINLDDLDAQLEMQLNSLVKYTEVLGYVKSDGSRGHYDHPFTLRRIAADKEFAECELLYKWRPDLLEPGKKLRSIEETNARCKKLIAVLEKGLGEKR